MVVIKRGNISSLNVKTMGPVPAFTTMDQLTPQQLEDVVEERIEERINEHLEARRQAELASTSKGFFLANLSHEIRTPMNSILGYSQMLLREGKLENEHKGYLEKIVLSSRHLLSLINDVLDLSKIEVGRMDVVESVFDLSSLLMAVDVMLAPKAQAKGLVLQVNKAKDLPKYIDADEVKLRQIVVNLVANAIKFTSEGSVNVDVDVFEDSDHRHFVKIEVSDTGRGVEAEQVEKLFKPFEQVNDNAEPREGTGLGLAISRGYAQLLGGDITLESEPGRGSKFTLIIPVRVDEGNQLTAGTGSERAGRVIGLKANSRPVRILVVDDNEDANLLTGRFLSSVGFEIDSAVDGEDALRVFHQFKPHMVLMDRRMPKMDGLEAMRIIKNSDQGRNIPVVIITASVFDEDYKECMICGADAFIRKPYLEEELLREISRLANVQYEYGMQENITTVIVTTEHLRTVPRDAIKAIAGSIIKGDLDELLASFERLDGVDERVRDSLKIMAKGYQYDELLSLMSEDVAVDSSESVRMRGGV